MAVHHRWYERGGLGPGLSVRPLRSPSAISISVKLRTGLPRGQLRQRLRRWPHGAVPAYAVRQQQGLPEPCLAAAHDFAEDVPSPRGVAARCSAGSAAAAGVQLRAGRRIHQRRSYKINTLRRWRSTGEGARRTSRQPAAGLGGLVSTHCWTGLLGRVLHFA